MWKSLKRWPVLVALLVAVGALAVGLAYLRFASRVTRENCERIKEGMTWDEVCAILGRPWDARLLDPEEPTDSDTFRAHELRSQKDAGGRYGFWMGSDLGIFIAFDGQHGFESQHGRVILTHLCTDPDRPRSWLPARVWRRLRARYGW